MALAVIGLSTAIAVTATPWTGPRVENGGPAGGPRGAATADSRSSVAIRFPTLSWRPLRIGINLRSASTSTVAAIVTVDDIPIRRVSVGPTAATHELLVRRGRGPLGGLSIRLDAEPSPGGAPAGGLRVTDVSVAPAGLSPQGVWIMAIGVAGGLVVWLALPVAAAPRRAALGTLVGRLAALDSRPGWRRLRHQPPAMLIGALSVAPLGLLASLVWIYAVDVPFGDQWELVPLLEALATGSLGLAEVWAPHNEHRIVLPRVVMLALAQASGWNIRLESFVNILLAVATVAVVASLIARHVTARSRAGLWAIPVVAILAFSAKQWENWLWGWQLQIFLNVLAVTAMVALLTSDPLRRRHVAAAAAMAIVATLSFAAGVAAWVVGLAAIWLSDPRARLSRSAWWVAAAVATMVVYVGAGPATATGTAPLSGLTDASAEQMAVYLVKYLGTPLAGRPSTAVVAGSGGLVLLGWLVVDAIRGGRASAPGLAFLLLGLYPIGAGVMTAFGRAGLGTDQAMSSRYVTMSSVLWIAIVAHLASAGDRQADQRATPWVTAAFVLMLGLVSLRASYYAVPAFESRHERLETGRAALIDGRDAGLEALYPNTEVVRRRRAVLRSLELSAFRPATNR